MGKAEIISVENNNPKLPREELERSFLVTGIAYFGRVQTGFYGAVGDMRDQLTTLNGELQQSSKASTSLTKALNLITFAGVVVAVLTLSLEIYKLNQVPAAAAAVRENYTVGATYRYIGDGKFEHQKVIDFKDLK